MGRFSVVVAEDERQALADLRSMIAAQDDFSVVAVASDGRETMEAVRRYRPDLLFLDIELPRSAGIDVLRALPSAHRPEVVFVTTRDGRGVGALEGEALDCLRRPFDEGRLAACLERARRRLGADEASGNSNPGHGPGRRYLERFLARGRGGAAVVLGVDRVDWLEADDNHVILHAGGDRFRIRDSLKSLDERLDPYRFARVHRSAIVNLDRVREVRPLLSGDFELLLAGGERVRLSRTFRRSFEERVRGLP